jgi:hypothetical protein
MRKIIAHKSLNPDTFAPIVTVVVKNSDGSKNVYKQTFDAQKDPMDKYTEEQRRTLNGINYVLEENDQPIMTLEEMDWAADPYGVGAREKATTEEELQALSGFTIKKIVTEFPNKQGEKYESINLE